MAQTPCTTVTYWLGSTTERFTISNTILNESSDITTDPNSGSGPGSTLLDFVWINNNFNIVNKFTFKGERHHVIDTLTGDAHVLVIVPTTIALENIGETVFGTIAGMTQGLHYDVFQILNGSDTFDVYYFRDLTSLELPKRQFQFDVVIA